MLILDFLVATLKKISRCWYLEEEGMEIKDIMGTGSPVRVMKMFSNKIKKITA